MTESLWVTASPIDGGCWRLEERTDAFSSLSLTDAQSPDFVTLIGGPAKTKLLRELTAFTSNAPANVHLFAETQSCRGDTPRIFVDCELHRRQQSAPQQHAGPASRRNHEVAWARQRGQAEIAHLFYNRVLAPLSSVVCYFASDLGGLRGVGRLIAEQLTSGLPNNRLQPDALPRALVIVDTTTYVFDAWSAEARLYREIETALEEMGQESGHTTLEKDSGPSRLTSDVLDHFREIRVLGLHKDISPELRSKLLRRCIASVSTSVQSARRASRMLFTTRHARAFLEMLVEDFCNGQEKFDYIIASRAAGFSTQDLPNHVQQLLGIVPSDGWLWHTATPLLASALLLASYPPGSHYFAPKTVFSRLYRGVCDVALIEHGTTPEVREKFITAVEGEFERGFCDLLEQGVPVARLHLDTLKLLQTSLVELKSHRSCLCCLMRTPEKVLSCKHALCDVCVQTFGIPSVSEKYTFTLHACPLCGAIEDDVFTFIPPTAGIRILTLDGGGVRGVVELAIIKQIYAKFSHLLLPLPDFFDYVCGTSAGGLIVLGLFLMQWDPEQCLEKFERLASQTFGGPIARLNPMSQLRTLVSYVRDGKYESHIIEAAFQTLTKRPTQMFNPLKSETKVAVTTTTAKDVLTCLFANYNGIRRPSSIGYQIVRAQRPQDDVMVHEAASSTSAAPWFFKPKVLRNLGTFQDGGLQHNNPLGIALCEYRFLWPNRGEPDFALSIGTGTSFNDAQAVFEPRSPVHDRSLRRLFRSFMRSTDGEKAWRDFINTVSESQKHRYHRLNISLGDLSPDIDDVSTMKRLRHKAEDQIASSPELRCVYQAMFASMFYLELVETPTFDGDSYVCSAVIFCRMDMPKEGRKALYDDLLKSSYYFLLDGQPLRCIETIPRGLPLYRKRVEFRAPTMDHQVSITLAAVGDSSPSHYISGLPRKLEDLVACQRLNAPFGRINHQSFGRRLPPLPVKRKRGHPESGEYF